MIFCFDDIARPQLSTFESTKSTSQISRTRTKYRLNLNATDHSEISPHTVACFSKADFPSRTYKKRTPKWKLPNVDRKFITSSRHRNDAILHRLKCGIAETDFQRGTCRWVVHQSVRSMERKSIHRSGGWNAKSPPALAA